MAEINRNNLTNRAMNCKLFKHIILLLCWVRMSRMVLFCICLRPKSKSVHVWLRNSCNSCSSYQFVNQEVRLSGIPYIYLEYSGDHQSLLDLLPFNNVIGYVYECMVNKGTSSSSPLFQFCLGLQSTSDAETVIKTIHLHSKRVSHIIYRAGYH